MPVALFFVKYPVVGFAIVTSTLVWLYATAPLSFVQFMNIFGLLFTTSLFQSSLQKIVVRVKQALNIALMSVTFSVLKFETSKEVRAEQPLNIDHMLVTFAVLKFVTSIEVSAEQP